MHAPSAANPATAAANRSTWKQTVAQYRQPSLGKAVWQLLNTLLPYLLLWYLAWLSLKVSVWLALPLIVLAAGFLVRLFIIFHDCTHGSFFRSKRANDLIGWLTGLLTFTPYHCWRWQHGNHHATSGDLDRRGTGDVWTLTVQEYLESSRWKRLAYRMTRNPFILFLIAPLLLFLVINRFSPVGGSRRERRSVHRMNLAVLIMAVAMSAVFGLKPYLIIQFGVMLVSGTAGVWLFYVQHQFAGVYWERNENWDYVDAALRGSSYHQLPPVLRWFSGNIGFHHIHHLSPNIPNYNLQRCHDAEPLFRQVPPVTLLSSLRSLTFRLWDEQQKQLVGFRHLKPGGKSGTSSATTYP